MTPIQNAARVLVVDDESSITEALEEALTAAGYAVTTVPSGNRALVLIEQHPPDVMLLDIDMPGTNGVEVLRRLRASGSSIPVIMLSGKADATLAGDVLAMGAFDFVAKPFDFAHLMRVVGAACASNADADPPTP